MIELRDITLDNHVEAFSNLLRAIVFLINFTTESLD